MFDLQKFMNRIRVTQNELAKQIGVSLSKVGAWSAGYRKPGYEDIVLLLKAGMTISELFGDDVEKVVLRSQPSLDPSQLSPEDCRRIVSVALGTIAAADPGLKK